MLVELSQILAAKKPFMFSFTEHYLFKRVDVEKTEMLNDIYKFKKIIRFCLMTAQRTRLNLVNSGVQYFSNNYKPFKNAIANSNWDKLVEITYTEPGVGQKIGSLILEVFIHYGELNQSFENKLFVPIDTHIKRIFSECLGFTDVSENGIPIILRNNKYHNFQQLLFNNTSPGLPRIYFDYLWFVGKVFCTAKLNQNNTNTFNRAYRLCSICWLKDICICPERWNDFE